MTKDRLIKLSKKISKLVKGDDLEKMNYDLSDLVRKHKDYFDHFTKEDLFKILFYIFSIKKTGDVSLGEKILDRVEFISFFITNNENAREDCDYCDGGGRVTCSECEGEGTTTCRNCQGNGKVDCDECDSTGEDEEGNPCDFCEGSGQVDCDECNEGSITCSECYGDGDMDCSDCDGVGEIIKDTLEYTDYFVVTWNKELIKIAKDLVELEQPYISSDEFFEKFGSDMLILQVKDRDDNFGDDLDSDVVYFYSVTDNPEFSRHSPGFFPSHNYNLYIN